jgi:hypothetical protein
VARTTRPMGLLRETSLQLRGHVGWSYDLGDRRIPFLELTWQTQLRNFWRLTLAGGPDLDTFIDNRETRDGARVERGRRGALYFDLSLKSDPSRPVFFQANASTYQVQHGLALVFRPSLTLRPTPPFELQIFGNASWSYGDPRWMFTSALTDGSRAYYFGELDARDVDATLRALYAFTNTLTIQAYAQAFLASGHYERPTVAGAGGDRPLITQSAFVPVDVPAQLVPDFRLGNINLNLLLRWEYSPGATLTLVYNRTQQQVPYDPSEGAGRLALNRFVGGPTTDSVLLKLTYLWQPLR